MLVRIWCLVILFLRVCSGTPTIENYDEFNSHSKFVSRMERLLISNSKNLSVQCYDHMNHYIESLVSKDERRAWAWQMFDSGAKLPSGLLEGNAADLGAFDECLNVETDMPPSNKIYGKYCIGTIPRGSKSTYYEKRMLEAMAPEKRVLTPGGDTGLQLATCLPHSCSAGDIEKLYSLFGMVFYEELCQTKFSQPERDGGSIAIITVFGVILLVMVISTIYDAAIEHYEKKPHHSLLIAFSVLTNGRKIIATTESPNQISCLHGIRVISTMWVIIGHRYSTTNSFPVKNSAVIINWMLDQANMFIMEATLSVDTFFFISGLVVAYSYMSAISKGAKFNIIIYYLHRYFRLTPVLVVIMVIHMTLLKHLGSGPFWLYVIQRDVAATCEKYWWKTLLYIQNYGDQDAYCIGQSWYLSVDMQLYLLSPILLIPLKRWPGATLLATGFLTACSILACFLTGWFYEPGKITNYIIKYYYMATHTRAAPWLIGIMLGYVIFVCKQRKTKLIINKGLILLGWIISLAVLCTCVFAGHDLKFGAFDQVGNSFLMSFQRPSWAVAVGFVIFACTSGYGGIVNWFLSCTVFQVLSKLTYSMYLSHAIVLYLVTAQMRDTPRFSNGLMMYVFWGDLAITLVVSTVLTLAFESPLITIEKLLFGSTKKEKGSALPTACEKSPTETV